MTPDPGRLLPEVERAEDPYNLTPEGIREPPKGWGPSLRYFGPGLILSASIVGSGELIATTTLGAQVGFAILWMVIFSTLVKVAVVQWCALRPAHETVCSWTLAVRQQ